MMTTFYVSGNIALWMTGKAFGKQLLKIATKDIYRQ